MNKVYCRYCGNLIDEDSTFCTHCGKKQNVTKASSWNTHSLSNMGNTIAHKASNLTKTAIGYLKTIKFPKVSNKWKQSWTKHIKQTGKVVLILGAIALVITLGIRGYSYYYYNYLPEKRLNEACSDVINKMHSEDKNVRLEISRKILLNQYAFNDDKESWGYDNVPNNKITDRLSRYRNEAFRMIESEAYSGNPGVQYLLGQIYVGHIAFQPNYRVGGNRIVEREYAVNPDTVKAVYWWNEAAKQGYVKAYNQLGVSYRRGYGVKKDLTKAVEFLKLGAESGEPSAQLNYGDLYRDGVKIRTGSHEEKRREETPYGIYLGYRTVTIQDSTVILPKDIEQAKYWWAKSAAQGNVTAKERLQKVYD